MIEVRPITRADVQAFHERAVAAGSTKLDPFERTMRGWAIDKDGETVCIAGLIFDKTYIEAFSDFLPNIDAPKRTIWRYGRILAQKIRDLNLPAIAIAKEDWPNSGKFLESVGFKYIGKIEAKETYRI